MYYIFIRKVRIEVKTSIFYQGIKSIPRKEPDGRRSNTRKGHIRRIGVLIELW